MGNNNEGSPQSAAALGGNDRQLDAHTHLLQVMVVLALRPAGDTEGSERQYATHSRPGPSWCALRAGRASNRYRLLAVRVCCKVDLEPSQARQGPAAQVQVYLVVQLREGAKLTRLLQVGLRKKLRAVRWPHHPGHRPPRGTVPVSAKLWQMKHVCIFRPYDKILSEPCYLTMSLATTIAVVMAPGLACKPLQEQHDFANSRNAWFDGWDL